MGGGNWGDVPEGWARGEDSRVLPKGWNSAADQGGLLDEMFDWAHQVYERGACSLPGVPIRYDNFMSGMYRAVVRGYVLPAHADFVARGLRYGFDAGLQRALLHGQRAFANYPPAEVDYRAQVEQATLKRVAAGRTLDLMPWGADSFQLLRDVFGDFFIFPLSAQEKPLEPGVVRPLDDHTRTGLNAATFRDFLRHTVRSFEDVAFYLRSGYAMHVSDVDAAFPMLPWTPWVWPFLLHRHYREGQRLASHRTVSVSRRIRDGRFCLLLHRDVGGFNSSGCCCISSIATSTSDRCRIR